MNRIDLQPTFAAIASCVILTLSLPALASVVPTAQLQDVRPLTAVDRLLLPPVDAAKAAAEDQTARLQGEPVRLGSPVGRVRPPAQHRLSARRRTVLSPMDRVIPPSSSEKAFLAFFS